MPLRTIDRMSLEEPSKLVTLSGAMLPLSLLVLVNDEMPHDIFDIDM